MAFKQFIHQLSTDMGFEQVLEANQDGSYSFRIEPNIDVTMRENAEAFILFHTLVADLPAQKEEEFLLNAMIANLFGRETGGAVLGVDQEGKKVVLVDSLPSNETYRTFYNRLEDFVNYADAWRLETTAFNTEHEPRNGG